jgi:hypothetical protein
MDNSVVLMLSGLITAGAGLMVDTRRERRRLGEIRSKLKSDLCNDLERAIALYEKLVADWQRHGTLEIKTLEALTKAGATYYDNPEWLGLFDELGCSKAVYQYHSSASRQLASIEHEYADLRGMNRYPEVEYEQARSRLDEAISMLLESRDQAVALVNTLEPQRNQNADWQSEQPLTTSS